MQLRNLEDEARKALMLFKSSRRPLIITHWDMDGVASAIAASWVLGKKPSFYIPPFTYKLSGTVLREIGGAASKADLVVVTDLAYPGPTLERLYEAVEVPVVVIDHHYQEKLPSSGSIVYYNPAYSGDPKGAWPSAAHVVATLTRVKVRDPLLLAASVAGDLGDAAVESGVFKSYMSMSGLDPEKDYPLVRDYCVKHVDGAAAMANRGALLNIFKMSVYHGERPCEVIMKDHLLATLSVQAEAELEMLASNAAPVEERLGGRILVYRLEGSGLHASRLARILAGRSGGKVVIIAYTSRNAGQGRIYARVAGSVDPPLFRVAECMKSLGYSAGGKTQPGNNVAAVEVDPRSVEEALNLMVKAVEEALTGRDPCKSLNNPTP